MALASWKMLKDAVLSFFEDEALTRGAATAFYTVTSVAPVLLIVVAITGRSPIGVTILRVSLARATGAFVMLTLCLIYRSDHAVSKFCYGSKSIQK